jgi:SAM-dependent methyltransferase
METQKWSPATLLQLSGGYWSSCALHAGVKLGIFTALSGEGATAAELAKKLGLNLRGLGMLLDALASLDLLEKSGALYQSTPFAVEFLSYNSPAYLGYIIQHHHHLMAGWNLLDEAVKDGQPVRSRVSHADDDKVRECFEMGMFNLAMMVAPKIVPHLDLAGRKRLLDLGGGPGTYAVHFCRHNPQLVAVVYDLPTTRKFAEQTIARFGLEQRVTFEDGDFIDGAILGSFDAAWLSHILHGEGPKECAQLLKKVVAALEPGGVLMVQEFILNNSKDAPVFPALFSLNMLLGTESGQAYSEGELLEMMTTAGLVDLKRLDIDLPNGAGILTGKVP